MWLIRRINLLSVNAARARQRISDAPGRQCGVRTRRCLDGSLWLVKSSKIQGKIGIKWRDHDSEGDDDIGGGRAHGADVKSNAQDLARNDKFISMSKEYKVRLT